VRVVTQYPSDLCKLTISNLFVFIYSVFIRKVSPVPACCLFKTSATSWPFDLESGVRVTCYNFSLPRPLCSRVRPDVCDRQTSDIRQKHRL